MGEERSILCRITPDDLHRCSALKDREHDYPLFKLSTADSDFLPESTVWKGVWGGRVTLEWKNMTNTTPAR